LRWLRALLWTLFTQASGKSLRCFGRLSKQLSPAAMGRCLLKNASTFEPFGRKGPGKKLRRYAARPSLIQEQLAPLFRVFQGAGPNQR
jgi:hypothetical protein